MSIEVRPAVEFDDVAALVGPKKPSPGWAPPTHGIGSSSNAARCAAPARSSLCPSPDGLLQSPRAARSTSQWWAPR